MRATWSTDPPGGKTAINRMGFVGHDWARHGAAMSAAMVNARATHGEVSI